MAFVHVQTKPTKERAKICKKFKDRNKLAPFKFPCCMLAPCDTFWKDCENMKFRPPRQVQQQNLLQPTPRRDLRPQKLQPESRPLAPGRIAGNLWHVSHWYLVVSWKSSSHPNKRTRWLRKLKINVKKLIKGIWEEALTAQCKTRFRFDCSDSRYSALNKCKHRACGVSLVSPSSQQLRNAFHRQRCLKLNLTTEV